MNRRLLPLFALAGSGFLGACASAPHQGLPLLVSTQLEVPTRETSVREANAARPVAPGMAAPLPLEATKWTRMNDSSLNPTATLGGYIGFSLLGFDHEGVMDGNTAIFGSGADGDDAILLPDLELDPGFALSIGYRGYKYGFELAWERIDREGDYTGFPDADVSFNTFTGTFRRYFWTEQRLQPYYLLGFSYVRVDLDDAAFDDATFATQLGDARLTGYTVNGGLGFNYLITRRLSFDARAEYRYGEYQDARSTTGGAETIDGDDDASNFGVLFGLQYIVKRDK
ncbi:MAG: hypothetical protein WD226_10305 [Planctomycetota bacterium]